MQTADAFDIKQFHTAPSQGKHTRDQFMNELSGVRLFSLIGQRLFAERRRVSHEKKFPPNELNQMANRLSEGLKGLLLFFFSARPLNSAAPVV